jgi:hypothetical protein
LRNSMALWNCVGALELRALAKRCLLQRMSGGHSHPGTGATKAL